jgi:hypothetical protein
MPVFTFLITFVHDFSLTTADEVLKGLAVIVGGLWTYLNYVRGRTFSKRLEIELTGTVSERDEVYFFNGLCRAKNVGLSKIPLTQINSGLSVSAVRLAKAKDGWLYTEDEELIALPLFERHGWIEPGEAISEPIAVPVAKSSKHLLGVRTQVMINNGKTIWSASSVTDITKKAKEESS